MVETEPGPPLPPGPPEEGHLAGPPVPQRLVDSDPDGRGKFGLWRWIPDGNRKRSTRLGGLMDGPVPDGYLLRVRNSRMVHDLDVAIESATIRRSARVENLTIDSPVSEDLRDYTRRRIFAGRWHDNVQGSRTGLGREVTAGGPFVPGQGVTFAAPEGVLGPAEAILGQGASITIRGQERINISGTSRWDAGLREIETTRQSKFPQLDLRQDLNIKVDGKVGDKVSIDWTEDSNQETPLANRIAIRYAGYEDEVVKAVELGNTNLSLPGTQFVSYNGQHQGLFGIKTQSEFGGLGLTVIASKQEGQTASNRFVGYAQETQRQIFDLDYLQRRFFFLVDPVDPLLTGQFLPPNDPRWVPPPIITELQVYRDDRNQQNNGGIPEGFALLNPSRAGADADSVVAFFNPLTEHEHFAVRNDLYVVLVSDSEGEQQLLRYPVLDLLSPIGRDEVLAATFTATYRIAGRDSVVRYGTQGGIEPVRAKALYIPEGRYLLDGDFYSRTDFWYPVRRLELRNIYSLGGTDIDLATLKLSVKRSAADDPLHFPGDTQATFLRGLGVDKTDVNGEPGRFDERIDREFVKPELGLITLPDLRPFAPAVEDTVWPFFRADLAIDGHPANRPAFFVEEHANRTVYDKRAASPGVDRKYFFDVSYATPQTQFVLSAPGTILEGSETVVVDGRHLARGSEYSIDYETGIVNLIGQTALPQNAQIAIDYAYAPLFALGQKTLMGFHAGWDPGTAVGGRRFGSTWLFESAGVAERRPKLGEEPSRTVVGDVNGGFQTKPFFMNQLVEALPGVRASADSRLDVSAEVGLSLPNPNTKGQVYIDDFEGVKENSILSLQREDWFWAALPDTIRQVSPLASRRGGLIWYNPVNSPVFERDLFPDLEREEGNNRKLVLTLSVDPVDTLGVEPASTWVGLTQGISASGADFTRKQFIEIWINDSGDLTFRQAHPKMLVDLGTMSEDAQWHPSDPPNGEWDREDKNEDGILDRSEDNERYEDTGLDGLVNEAEPGFNTPSTPDPNHDDFDFDREEAEPYPREPIPYFAGVNRFEDNNHLDDEDVNRDLTQQNSSSDNYFEYSIDLGDSLYVATDICQEFPEACSSPTENGPNGWRLFRIPVEIGRAVGNPSLSSVRHFRLWFTGIPRRPEGPMLLQIASIDILGNLFMTEPLRDFSGAPVAAEAGERFKVRGINNKEDANEYTPPFELEEQNRIEEREQSLAMDFELLRAGHEGSAFRALPSDRDLTLYETLKWYVYGGGDLTGVEAFVRFGADTLNYYEYAVPMRPGWNEEAIPLTELSGLKLESTTEDSCKVASSFTLPCLSRRLPDGKLLRYVGRPTFTRVRRVTFGVRNAGQALPSGTVWFDDLRLDDVIRDRGIASRVEIDAGFADFMTLSTNILTRDEDFLSIGSGGQRTVTRGAGSRQRDIGLRSTLNLHKFFETSGVKVPLAFNFTRNRELPEFQAGNDVVLSGTESQNQERGATQRSYSANWSRQGAQAGILKYTLDAVRADFSLNDRRGLSQTRFDSSRTINFGLAYSAIPGLKPIKLGQAEIRYFPDNITLGARLNSSRTFSYNRDLLDPEGRNLISAVYQKEANLNGSTSLSLLRSLRAGYRMDSRRDMTFENPAGWLGGLNIGAEVARSQNLDLNWTPPVLRTVAPNLSFRGSSRDDHSRSLQLPADRAQVRNISANQTLSGAFKIPIALLTSQSAPAAGDTTPGAWRRVKTQLGRVGRFRDIGVNVTANNSRDFSYATGVPRWLYQLGLSTHPGDDVDLTDRGRDTESRNRTASLSSGFEFQLGIGATTTYSWSRRAQEASFTEPRGGRTVTWPQVDLDWRSFHTRLPPLAKAFRSLSLESRYTRDRSESGPKGDESQNITERRDWNPLVGVNGTLTSGWNMRVRFSSTGSEDNDNEAGFGRFTNSTRRQVQINMTRRFDARSGLKFPWQKKPIKLKSDLTLNSDVTFSTDRSESGRQGQPAVLNRDGSTTSIRSGVGYNFKKNIDGEFSVNFGRNNNNKTGQKLRTISLSGSLVFNF